MGSCFSLSSVYDEMERACTAVKDPSWKLRTIQTILSTSEGEDYDVFRIIHREEWGQLHDCITLFLSETRGSWNTGDTIDTVILPVLQLMRKQIQKNRTTAAKKNKHFTTPQLYDIGQSYIEYVVEARHGRDEQNKLLKLFRFFLDNSEYFPLISRPNKQDKNNNNNNNSNDNSSSNSNNTLLHRLCQRDGKGNVEMLREYISSGFIEDCFKNVDNDGEKMKMALNSYSSEQYTPLEVACMQNKVEVVEELVVNKIGGRNYGAAIHLQLKPYHPTHRFKTMESIPNRETVQEKIVAICLLFLSQPGATQIFQRYVPNLVSFADECKLPDVKQCLLDNGIIAA